MDTPSSGSWGRGSDLTESVPDALSDPQEPESEISIAAPPRCRPPATLVGLLQLREAGATLVRFLHWVDRARVRGTCRSAPIPLGFALVRAGEALDPLPSSEDSEDNGHGAYATSSEPDEEP